MKKRCSICNEIYDDSFKWCMKCEKYSLVDFVEKPTVYLPLSLSKRRIAHDTSSKELFLPQSDFYDSWNAKQERLMQMMKDIFEWLHMDDNNVYGGYSSEIGYPGLYFYENGKYIILVQKKYQDNPYEVGAILAHECVHHFMRIRNIGSPNRTENEQMTDRHTIANGLGVIYINGMYYESYWWFTILALFAGSYVSVQEKKSFGYYKAEDYCKQLVSYLKNKKIDYGDVIGFIHPKARSFLPISFHFRISKKQPECIRKLAKKSNRNIAIQIAGVGLVGLLLLASLFLPNEKGKIEARLSETKKTLAGIEENVKISVEKLNTMKSRLEHYQNVKDYEHYNKLVNPYNALAAEVKQQYEIYNALVEKHNNEARKLNAYRQK